MKKFFSFAVATLFAVSMNAISVAEALQIAGQLEQGATTEATYEIEGYVTAMQGADDGGWAQYSNQIFWIADAQGTAASNADGALEIYQGVASEQVYVGDKVKVTGKLTNYQGLLETVKRAPVDILEKVERPEGGETEEADVVIAGADFAGQGTANTGSEVSVTKDGVTFACSKGYSDDAHATLRCYKDGVITITSETEQIGKLVFQFYTTYTGDLETEVVVNATEWTYTLPAQARIEKVSIFFGEFDPIEPEALDTLSAQDALARAQALEVGGTEKVAVLCYIASIKTPYDAQHGNVTVWLNDDITSTYGNIQAYRAKCSAEDGAALAEHDRVLVVGNLTHTQNQEGTKDYYEIAQGAQLTRLSGQGIENILLQENIQKVIVDGVVYVVRDGKMFNLQGAQVR
jgi:hypothetical protein